MLNNFYVFYPLAGKSSVVEQSPLALRGKNLTYLSGTIFSGQLLSSFMTWIPGKRGRVFVAAAIIAMLMAMLL